MDSLRLTRLTQQALALPAWLSGCQWLTAYSSWVAVPNLKPATSFTITPVPASTLQCSTAALPPAQLLRRDCCLQRAGETLLA